MSNYVAWALTTFDACLTSRFYSHGKLRYTRLALEL